MLNDEIIKENKLKKNVNPHYLFKPVTQVIKLKTLHMKKSRNTIPSKPNIRMELIN